MTGSNLDLVRSIFGDWERGEFGSSEWAHGEIEFEIADGFEPGIWTGLANAAGRLRVALSPWQGLRVEAEEYREVDDERILVLISYGRPREDERPESRGYAETRFAETRFTGLPRSQRQGEQAGLLLGPRARARRLRPRFGGRRSVTMSESLDLVRSIFTAWERGDFRSAEWAHPEIEFVRPDGPEPGSWAGLGGMAEAWREWLSVWEEFGNHADAYRELDDERVLVLTRRSGRGKISGLEIGELRTHGAQLFHVRNGRMRSQGASLFRVRHGKVTRLVLYWDSQRALADAGLAPEGAAADPNSPG